jgi:hypothetical protein
VLKEASRMPECDRQKRPCHRLQQGTPGCEPLLFAECPLPWRQPPRWDSGQESRAASTTARSSRSRSTPLLYLPYGRTEVVWSWNWPGKVDKFALGCCNLLHSNLLVLYRAEISQRGVPPSRVVQHPQKALLARLRDPWSYEDRNTKEVDGSVAKKRPTSYY